MKADKWFYIAMVFMTLCMILSFILIFTINNIRVVTVDYKKIISNFTKATLESKLDEEVIPILSAEYTRNIEIALKEKARRKKYIIFPAGEIIGAKDVTEEIELEALENFTFTPPLKIGSK